MTDMIRQKGVNSGGVIWRAASQQRYPQPRNSAGVSSVEIRALLIYSWFEWGLGLENKEIVSIFLMVEEMCIPTIVLTAVDLCNVTITNLFYFLIINQAFPPLWFYWCSWKKLLTKFSGIVMLTISVLYWARLPQNRMTFLYILNVSIVI